MFCRSCGNKLTEQAKFCPVCGQQVVQFENTPRQPTARNEILIRSENCNKLNEDRKKAINIKVIIQSNLISLAIFIPWIGPAIYEWLDDKKISQAKYPPNWVFWICFVISMIVAVRYNNKRIKARSVFVRYRGLCNTETLIVEDKKIYGTTTKGDLKLTYDQVKEVSIRLANSPSEDILVIEETINDILVIKDIVGNSYVFYSFTNCKDIKTVIQQQIMQNKGE